VKMNDTHRMISRRRATGLLAGLAAAMALPGPLGATPAAGLIRPPRLKAGDLVGLVEPASATWQKFDITLVEEVVAGLGLRSRRAAHLLGRNGYFSGEDKERAADINAMFADREVKAILAVRGGWGCARILPFVDFGLARAHPKPLIGYSDITALHMALQAKAQLISFHAPVGVSAWGKATVDGFKPMLFDGAMPLLQNPIASEDRLAQRKWRIRTLRGGRARGRLLGGNLTVLTALVGTPWLPEFTGAILFLEDIGEAEYRIDRMLTQLGQAGLLARLAGVAFGQCTDCVEEERGFGGFTLDDVLDQHFAPLGIPVFQGGFFGHIADQYTLPLGVMAQMDADAGTLQLLEPAVA
jgi:muramoyltetrapeptide carboxypeptidase